jgi:dTDP-4-dehydrorhamnose reductase
LIANIAADDTAPLPYGTYHAVGGEVTSRHGFAEAIVAEARRSGRLSRDVRVNAVPTAEYPTRARRPANSALQPSTELRAFYGVDFDWARGLRSAIAGLPLST